MFGFVDGDSVGFCEGVCGCTMDGMCDDGIWVWVCVGISVGMVVGIRVGDGVSVVYTTDNNS